MCIQWNVLTNKKNELIRSMVWIHYRNVMLGEGSFTHLYDIPGKAILSMEGRN